MHEFLPLIGIAVQGVFLGLLGLWWLRSERLERTHQHGDSKQMGLFDQPKKEPKYYQAAL
jgi:hypothetical protein